MLNHLRNHFFRMSGAEAPGTAGGDLRERSERLLTVGSDIIDRVLSGDSAAFNKANRQEEGQ